MNKTAFKKAVKQTENILKIFQEILDQALEDNNFELIASTKQKIEEIEIELNKQKNILNDLT